MQIESLNDVWEHVCIEIKKEISQTSFDTWISQLSIKNIKEKDVILFVKTDFQRNVILENYFKVIEESFYKVLGFLVQVAIQTEEDIKTSPFSEMAVVNNHYEYTFDTFIVGTNNEFAHAMAVAVSEKPVNNIFNPLFIYGNPGLGKTHLLYAIRDRVKTLYPEKNVVLVTAETFFNDFYASLPQNSNNPEQFRNKYRSADVLLIDDIQFMGGKDQMQVAFVNTFNQLRETNKQIVITSDRPPRDIASLDERIKNRFESGVLAQIEMPEFETRARIIERKAEALEFNLSEELRYYLAQELHSDIRQLEGVVKKLHAYSVLGHPINKAAVQNAINEMISEITPQAASVDNILAEVARTYGVSIEDIKSEKRDASISHARQVAMLVMREVTGKSYEIIGRDIGDKHYSTVLYACKNVKKVMKNNSKENNTIETIIKNLKSPK